MSIERVVVDVGIVRCCISVSAADVGVTLTQQMPGEKEQGDKHTDYHPGAL